MASIQSYCEIKLILKLNVGILGIGGCTVHYRKAKVVCSNPQDVFFLSFSLNLIKSEMSSAAREGNYSEF